uniref:Uncharacterized protein n=1 Tax=Cacopsylla melanoneura TaxID=428564 RepID=A0A8D8PRY1_9HEMI
MNSIHFKKEEFRRFHNYVRGIPFFIYRVLTFLGFTFPYLEASVVVVVLSSLSVSLSLGLSLPVSLSFLVVVERAGVVVSSADDMLMTTRQTNRAMKVTLVKTKFCYERLR